MEVADGERSVGVQVQVLVQELVQDLVLELDHGEGTSIRCNSEINSIKLSILTGISLGKVSDKTSNLRLGKGMVDTK